jgi:3-oxoacyl-[acyl-carrier-protein] synthase II
LKEKIMERRIVITGLGTINPLANNVKEFWEKTKKAENGIGSITRFDASAYPSQVAGEIKNFNPDDYLEKKDSRRMDRFALYAVVAAIEAMQDAGIDDGTVNPVRMGCVLGNGIGGIETICDQVLRHEEKGIKGIHPLLIPKMISNIGPAQIAIRFNAQGPTYSVVTACSSAADAIGSSVHLLKNGTADVMISGGTEAPLVPVAIAGFCNLQALSTKYNDAPEKASRPFDKGRDGFIISEGAGIVILEELEHAKKRGAKIYAELAGFGISCDANHLTAPHPEGRGAIQAMQMALSSAGLTPKDIDYINAHGTSTPLNDPVETKAIKAVFGDEAKRIKISSTKSMVGHLLGGAGGVEAIICSLALKDQYYPPTRNLDEPDPECDLDYIPKVGMDGEMRALLSNSLGFGGHNGILCMKRFDE